MAFAYFVVFPIAFGFFAGYAPTGVQMMTDIDKYLSFVLTMFIAFGITFETPVVVDRAGAAWAWSALEKLQARCGLRHRRRVRHRRGIHAARLMSQLMMAVPLWLLYELGLLVARFISAPVPRDAAARRRGRIATLRRARTRAASAACRR